MGVTGAKGYTSTSSQISNSKISEIFFIFKPDFLI